jgi:hypothetical protein
MFGLVPDHEHEILVPARQRPRYGKRSLLGREPAAADNDPDVIQGQAVLWSKIQHGAALVEADRDVGYAGKFFEPRTEARGADRSVHAEDALVHFEELRPARERGQEKHCQRQSQAA